MAAAKVVSGFGPAFRMALGPERQRRRLNTTTFVAGLRNTGMVAPMVLDGPISRDAFTA